jgi:surface protein
MFTDCSALSTLNVNSFDVTNITGLNSMFYKCSLTTLDLSNWEPINAQSTSHMFYGCNKLKTLRLDNFDMRSVTDTTNMFAECKVLATLRLDNCSNDTISKIINSVGFPTGKVQAGFRPTNRILYCKESEAVGLTLPTGWVFSYVRE